MLHLLAGLVVVGLLTDGLIALPEPVVLPGFVMQNCPGLLAVSQERILS